MDTFFKKNEENFYFSTHFPEALYTVLKENNLLDEKEHSFTISPEPGSSETPLSFSILVEANRAIARIAFINPQSTFYYQFADGDWLMHSMMSTKDFKAKIPTTAEETRNSTVNQAVIDSALDDDEVEELSDDEKKEWQLNLAEAKKQTQMRVEEIVRIVKTTVEKGIVNDAKVAPHSRSYCSIL